jgi:hypothetical protein
MAGNALTVNTRTARVRVRARTGTRFAVVAYGNSIEVHRNSNQCAFKKRWPKRNIDRRQETLLYIGINIE